MTATQRTALDQLLRDGPLDLGGEVTAQRRVFEAMMAQVPVPPAVQLRPERVDAVEVVRLAVDQAPGDRVILYVHGGAFAIGTAASSAPLAGDLARRAGIDAVSVDYRLAPEHPFPAALDDILTVYDGLVAGGLAPHRIALAGESAGGGLVLSVLLRLRDRGEALPGAAVLMSPWADLTLTGESATVKQSVDPAVTVTGLRTRVADYCAGQDASSPLLSPVFGDLTDLPPLLVQVGSHEVLLSDAVRITAAAAAADVDVTLEVTAGVPHVFQAFAAILDEGSAALDRAARFLTGRLDQAAGAPEENGGAQ